MRRKRSESRRLDAMVSVRFSPDERAELERRARRMGLTMSGYLRRLALQPETLTVPDAPTVTFSNAYIQHQEAS